jgi:hypothetical protein
MELKLKRKTALRKRRRSKVLKAKGMILMTSLWILKKIILKGLRMRLLKKLSFYWRMRGHRNNLNSIWFRTLTI